MRRLATLTVAAALALAVGFAGTASAQLTKFTDETAFVDASGAVMIGIPDSDTAFPATSCGASNEPTGFGASVTIAFDSNDLTVTQEPTTSGLCIFDPGFVTPLSNTNPNDFSVPLLVANGEDDYKIVFDTPVAAIGFLLLTNSSSAEIVTLKDSGGAVIDSAQDISADTPNNGRQFIGFISTVPIKTVIFDTTGGASQNEGFEGFKAATFLPLSKELTSGPADGVFTKVFNGITNGSFEDDGCGPPFDSPLGPGGLTGWTIGGAGIDLICGLWDGQEGGGSQSLDMSRATAGSVSQTLTTIAGRAYEIRFWMSGNPQGGNAVKDLRVSVDNVATTTEDFSFDITSDCGGACSVPSNMGWTLKTFAFTADAASTIVTFLSLEANAFGPALDNVMLFREGVAIAIQIVQTQATDYDFTITYAPAESDPDNVVIIDTVPAEWDVSKIDGVGVADTNDAPHKGPNQGDGVGPGCGESESGLGNDGNVEIERGGKLGKKCSSDTDILWTLTPSLGLQTLLVDVTTRQSPSGKVKFKPTSCGKLTINDGAQAFEADGQGNLVLRLGGVPGGAIDPNGEPVPIGDPSNSLMLVAVDDLNGGGLVGDGSGDEDGDGLTDADEAFNVGTNPCDPDTDGDGVLDGADQCPLRGKEETGFVDVDGCPITP